MTTLGLDQPPPAQSQSRIQRLTLGQFLTVFFIFSAIMGLAVYIVASRAPATPLPPHSVNQVEGWRANILIAEQADRHRQFSNEIRALADRKDFDGFVLVVRTRAMELDRVIREVESDSNYSISDKRKILQLLGSQRDFLLSSYIGLKSVN